jgi:hypothetical protein
MRQLIILAGACLVSLAATPNPARRAGPSSFTRLESRREIVVVYLAVRGAGMDSGSRDILQQMRRSLEQTAKATKHSLVMRGVSLTPSISEGVKELVAFGTFDEVSVGGNWTNMAAVRYLGPTMSATPNASIPQVVVLEREITQTGGERLEIGPEREIARLHGASEMLDWIKQGTPVAVR